MRRKLRASAYAARRGATIVGKTPLTSLAIAAAIAATLAAVGLLRLTTHNLNSTEKAATAEPALIVYLGQSVTDERVQAISTALETLEGTSDVEIVSSHQAKARLELELAHDAELIADLDAQFFPTTIEVGLKPGVSDAAAMHPFVERLERIGGVESVDVLEASTDRAAALFGSVRSAAGLLSIFLTVCAMFVVVVLVRSSAGSARTDRELFRQLGATSAFAIAPDIVAGTIRGFAGGALAAAVLYAFFVAVGPEASASLANSFEVPSLVFIPVSECIALVFGGAALGAVGAAIAERETMHV